jgi:hypothetical protein
MFSHCRTHEELKAAYRKASMKHHPDRGGSAELFMDMSRQMAKRRRELDEPPKKPFIDLPPEMADRVTKIGEKLVDNALIEIRKTVLDSLKKLITK